MLQNVYVYIIYAFTYIIFFPSLDSAHIHSTNGMRVCLREPDHPSKAPTQVLFAHSLRCFYRKFYMFNPILTLCTDKIRRIGAADARRSSFNACVVSRYMDPNSERGTATSKRAKESRTSVLRCYSFVVSLHRLRRSVPRRRRSIPWRDNQIIFCEQIDWLLLCVGIELGPEQSTTAKMDTYSYST